MRAVTGAITGRGVVDLGDVLLAEAGEVVTGADDLVIAGGIRELLAALALAVEGGRDRYARIAGEGRVLRPDPGVDVADDEAGAGAGAATQLRPQAASRIETQERRRKRRVNVAELVALEIDHPRHLRECLRLACGQVS